MNIAATIVNELVMRTVDVNYVQLGADIIAAYVNAPGSSTKSIMIFSMIISDDRLLVTSKMIIPADYNLCDPQSMPAIFRSVDEILSKWDQLSDDAKSGYLALGT